MNRLMHSSSSVVIYKLNTHLINIMWYAKKLDPNLYTVDTPLIYTLLFIEYINVFYPNPVRWSIEKDKKVGDKSQKC
jgi:hypothetical protein